MTGDDRPVAAVDFHAPAQNSTVLALQRLAGNAAVTQYVQRQHRPRSSRRSPDPGQSFANAVRVLETAAQNPGRSAEAIYSAIRSTDSVMREVLWTDDRYQPLLRAALTSDQLILRASPSGWGHRVRGAGHLQ